MSIVYSIINQIIIITVIINNKHNIDIQPPHPHVHTHTPHTHTSRRQQVVLRVPTNLVSNQQSSSVVITSTSRLTLSCCIVPLVLVVQWGAGFIFSIYMYFVILFGSWRGRLLAFGFGWICYYYYSYSYMLYSIVISYSSQTQRSALRK